MQILILNGPNLDVLSRRDPKLYGGLSINELESRIYQWAHALDVTARCRQTNSEGEFIEWIAGQYAPNVVPELLIDDCEHLKLYKSSSASSWPEPAGCETSASFWLACMPFWLRCRRH